MWVLFLQILLNLHFPYKWEGLCSPTSTSRFKGLRDLECQTDSRDQGEEITQPSLYLLPILPSLLLVGYTLLGLSLLTYILIENLLINLHMPSQIVYSSIPEYISFSWPQSYISTPFPYILPRKCVPATTGCAFPSYFSVWRAGISSAMSFSDLPYLISLTLGWRAFAL